MKTNFTFYPTKGIQNVYFPYLPTGARCVRKKKNKKYYIILQGGELTCFHFLSRRVKLIVTSERLNIFKKIFSPVESQVIFLSKETPIVSVGLRTAEVSYTNQNKTA